MTAAASSKGLNIALWVVQFLLFAAFGMAGFMKATAPISELSKNMPWVPRFSPGMVRFIGIAELCGALGMILPSLSRIKPMLTPLAGLGLTVVMVLAAGHHLMNGEAKMAPIPLALGALAAFVAWGRWTKAPITPR
jgi:putative oxidoreductase